MKITPRVQRALLFRDSFMNNDDPRVSCMILEFCHIKRRDCLDEEDLYLYAPCKRSVIYIALSPTPIKAHAQVMKIIALHS